VKTALVTTAEPDESEATAETVGPLPPGAQALGRFARQPTKRRQDGPEGWSPAIAILVAWPLAVIAVSAVRVGIGLALFLSGQIQRSASQALPPVSYAALAATFGIVGLTLVAANRRDVRATWLGGGFILGASLLTTPLLNASSIDGVRWLIHVRIDAFLPTLLWHFVSEFPAPLTGRSARAARVLWQTAALIGAALTLVSLSYFVWPRGTNLLGWRLLFTPLARPGSAYYPLVFGLSVAALMMLLWRVRRAGGDDRRRALVFTVGLLGGCIPLVLNAILEVFPRYYQFIHRPGIELALGLVLFGALATTPLVTAYSVLFDHVVELRVVLRAAAQYGLARYTILAVTMVPFVALALFVIRHREEPLTALLSGPRPVSLGAAAAAGIIAMRLRRRWLEGVDHRFFREQYDARQTLERLANDALHATDTTDLGVRIHSAIDPALHASASLFVADEKLGLLRDPQGTHGDLGMNATLMSLAGALDEPLDIDPSDDRSPFRRLSAEEQRWLLRGRFRLLIPLRGSEGRPVGLLALTAKRSGLDYSNDDRRLLSSVATPASLALVNLRLRTTPDQSSGPAALECGWCSRLHAPDATACGCGGHLVASSAPYLLRGVYRLDFRIGAGGMGVVYLARDLELGRPVAVKTLPRVTPEAASRLRAEARAMAAVVHPNLAVIHGIETWRGIPFLVEEFLAGGTLADRLWRRRLSVVEALDLGTALADALGHLHAAGFVHRDIKPSNIGFTLAGVLKVLDFGLARLVGATAGDPVGTKTAGASQSLNATTSSEPSAVGTLTYMAPEALMGGRPRPSFDLWALGVVLYESLTGRRPFEGAAAVDLAYAIASGSLVPASGLVEGCVPEIDDFLSAALSLDVGRRPADANAVRVALQRLRAAYPDDPRTVHPLHEEDCLANPRRS
jgi:hypothetical protein